MANTENIEAKLCAYVDGELDAAGRAEIEAHLAANPQHRQLIDELRGQRDLLRDLPRAAAPGDLLESVHSQLERSALLDGAGGGEGDRTARDIAGRISPWPRIISVAAVLTMAIGLFAVIYYVLPQNSARMRRGEYASGTGTNRTPSGSRFSTTDRSFSALTTAPTGAMAELDKDLSRSKVSKDGEANGRADKHTADAIARDDTAGAIGGAAAPATHPDVFAKAGQMDEAKAGDGSASFTNIFADAETEEKLKRSADVPSNSLVMVVASADPSQAQGQVQKYLDNNKITWKCVTEPVPQMDLKDSQVMSGSRLGSTQMHLKGGGSNQTFAGKGGGGSAKQEAQQGAREDLGQMKKEAASEMRPQQQQIALAPAGSPPPSPSTPNVASNAAPAQVYDLTAAPPATAPAAQPSKEADAARKVQTDQQLTLKSESPAPAAAAAPSPALRPAQAEQDLEAQSQQPQAQQQLVLPQQEPQQQQAPMSQAGGSPPQVIVARGLTRRQVSELNSSLATQNAGRVYNYRRSGDNFTPTTLPAATTSPAAALALTVSRNDLEKTEPAATPAVPGAAATTQPAAPRSPARELSANGAKSTDQFGGTSANAAVATTMPASVATSGPVAQKQFDALLKSDQSSTTMPSAEAVATAAPTSQPAAIGAGTATATGATTMAMGATTHPSGDERMDVVICIQPPGVIAGEVREINGANGAVGAPAATQPLIAPNAAASEPAPNDAPPSDSNDSAK